MENLFVSNLQSKDVPATVKYRQELMATTFTNMLETGLEECDQAQKSLVELTKKAVRDLKPSPT